MTNPIIQTDIAEILKKLDGRFDKLEQKLDGMNDRVGRLEVGIAEIKGDIKSTNERLSGQIQALDERLSGQIQALDKRLSNVKTSVQKIPDLAEKVGEFKWWKQTIIILTSGSVGALRQSINFFVGNFRTQPFLRFAGTSY
jgi:prefoldin subunit 5